MTIHTVHQNKKYVYKIIILYIAYSDETTILIK